MKIRNAVAVGYISRKMFCYPTTSIYNKLGNVDLLIAYTNMSGTFLLILSLYKAKTKDSVVDTVKKLVPG